MGVIKMLHVSTLKMFYGTVEDAYRVAMLDGDQHLIERVLGWRGDPYTRTTMEFEVLFADQDVVMLPYNNDLALSLHFGEFVESIPMLFPLRYTQKEALEHTKFIRSQPITTVKPGKEFFLKPALLGDSMV